MALSIFSSKKEKAGLPPILESQQTTDIVQAFNNFGKQRAEEMGGSPQIIHPMLHEVYMRIKQQVEKDEQKQTERKAELQSKIDLQQSELDNHEQKKFDKKKELDFEEHKIEEKKSEIAAIRQDPSRILKEKGSPIASFVIGLIIILFLTVYLFVFYSSAAYSAFFKEFTNGKMGIAAAIFDAQAIGKAMGDGIMEVILICTIPAVFLGLGYLIHRFSNDSSSKPVANFAKIGALIVVTFLFDTILAYEIVEKIYELQRAGSFTDMPPYNLSMAFVDVRFWTIIFSGFVVYIIWGLVFNFVMKEYYKLDRVKTTIDELEKKIADYKVRCKELKTDIAKEEESITTINGKIKELKNTMASTVVLKSDVRLGINEAVNGWIAYMTFHNFSDADKKLVIETKDAFLASIASQFETF